MRDAIASRPERRRLAVRQAGAQRIPTALHRARLPVPRLLLRHLLYWADIARSSKHPRVFTALSHEVVGAAGLEPATTCLEDGFRLHEKTPYFLSLTFQADPAHVLNPLCDLWNPEAFGSYTFNYN